MTNELTSGQRKDIKEDLPFYRHWLLQEIIGVGHALTWADDGAKPDKAPPLVIRALTLSIEGKLEKAVSGRERRDRLELRELLRSNATVESINTDAE